MTTDVFRQAQSAVLAQLQTLGFLVAAQSLTLLTTLVDALVDVVVVLILSVYLGANGPHIARWLQRETPSCHREHVRLLILVVSRVIGGYVRGTLTLALLIGGLVGAGLSALGVPYALLLGVLAFSMEFVPFLGVIISGVASVLVALAVGWQKALLVLGYFVLVHIVEGEVVGPRIMGHAVGIHPATGLLALVAGTELFGVWERPLRRAGRRPVAGDWHDHLARAARRRPRRGAPRGSTAGRSRARSQWTARVPARCLSRHGPPGRKRRAAVGLRSAAPPACPG